MSEYALVSPEGVIVAHREFASVEDVPQLSANKGRWLPIITSGETFDPVSQVREGPTDTVGADQVARIYTVRAKTADELDAMRQAKKAALGLEFAARSYATIDYPVGGTTYTFDADKDAIENISGVVTLIVAGITVPNPRPWTPHGSLTPVNVSHAELIGLGAAIAARKDALFVKKKALETALFGLTDPAAIDSFNPAQGWE